MCSQGSFLTSCSKYLDYKVKQVNLKAIEEILGRGKNIRGVGSSKYCEIHRCI
jgi:hypothetical protein